jgi:MSHA pilin protein MshC
MNFRLPKTNQMADPVAKSLAIKPCSSRLCGFTLVEMVSVLVIFALLAVLVLPRFVERQAFDVRIFSDQAQSMLRHAQKIAIAQNRDVHVRLNGASIAFCFNPFVLGDESCGIPVPAPGGENSRSTNTLARCSNRPDWFCEAVPDDVNVNYAATVDYAAAPATQYFYFSALGRPFYRDDPVPVSNFVTLDITFSGGGLARHLFVEAETGYVHP